MKLILEKAKKNDLVLKSVKLIKKYKGYKIEYLLLGMQNLEEYL